MKAYKGFNADWTCLGFQFEVGKTYTHESEISLCKSGFHACEYPLDIWSYYPLDGKFAQVELEGVSDKTDGDSKRVGKSITIKAELDIAGLVSAAVEWTTAHADGKSIASGDSSSAASSGNYSRAASSGDYSSAASSGDQTIAMVAGFRGTAMAGPDGCIALAWDDGNRPRITVGYVGEDGIEPNVAYRCDADGKLVRA